MINRKAQKILLVFCFAIHSKYIPYYSVSFSCQAIEKIVLFQYLFKLFYIFFLGIMPFHYYKIYLLKQPGFFKPSKNIILSAFTVDFENESIFRVRFYYGWQNIGNINDFNFFFVRFLALIHIRLIIPRRTHTTFEVFVIFYFEFFVFIP